MTQAYFFSFFLDLMLLVEPLQLCIEMLSIEESRKIKNANYKLTWT